MKLFKYNHDKPGPGVPKNAPRKKGLPRFGEIIGRDISNLVKVNLLYQLCILPAMGLFGMALLGGLGPGFLGWGLAALVAAIPLGPAKTAMNYCVSKMLMDEPGFIWHDFKRIFKENFKNTVIPGLCYALIVGAQVMALLAYLLSGAGLGVTALLFFSVILFAMVAPYFFAQAPFIDLKTSGVLKNSVLLALGYAPRSLAGALLGAGLVLAQFIFFPYATPFTLLIGYAVPCLLNQMWIWPKIDATYHIEAELKKRREQEFAAPTE